MDKKRIRDGGILVALGVLIGAAGFYLGYGMEGETGAYRRLGEMKAREIGYAIEGKAVSVRRGWSEVVVYYWPDEMNVMGNDLEIRIDRKTGEVLDVKRGQ